MVYRRRWPLDGSQRGRAGKGDAASHGVGFCEEEMVGFADYCELCGGVEEGEEGGWEEEGVG